MQMEERCKRPEHRDVGAGLAQSARGISSCFSQSIDLLVGVAGFEPATR